MSEGIQSVTDSEFEAKVLKSTSPTLVDFWAEWCGPCRALTPVVQELAREFGGKLQVVQMNVEEQPQTPSQYAVKALPTLLVFKAGRVVDQIVGLVPKAKLQGIIARHVE